jgi:hypothetical protein
LGIIGEYLARLHMKTMEKPAYTVRGEIKGEEISPGLPMLRGRD